MGAVQRHDRLLGGVSIHPNEAPRLAARGVLDEALAEIALVVGEPADEIDIARRPLDLGEPVADEHPAAQNEGVCVGREGEASEEALEHPVARRCVVERSDHAPRG